MLQVIQGHLKVTVYYRPTAGRADTIAMVLVHKNQGSLLHDCKKYSCPTNHSRVSIKVIKYIIIEKSYYLSRYTFKKARFEFIQ